MFRFTIRDVLWLTVVVAMAVAWWLDRGATSRMLDDNTAKIDALSSELKVSNISRDGAWGLYKLTQKRLDDLNPPSKTIYPLYFPPPPDTD